MQGCQATGKSSKSQASRARTVLRGTSCPQRRPVDQPPHPEGSHTTVVPFYPAPLLTALVFLSIPPWPDTRPALLGVQAVPQRCFPQLAFFQLFGPRLGVGL